MSTPANARGTARAAESWAKRYRAWSNANYDYCDRKLTEIVMRRTFWRRLFAYIWMPFAYQSGIRLVERRENGLSVLLPFKRPNRNWYGNIGGAALLGNAELAAGMYLFERCGVDCIIVCKQCEFDFHANCCGPALYLVTPEGDIDAKIEKARPFEAALHLDVRECARGSTVSGRKRVGRCRIVFSVTQKCYLPRRKRPIIPV